MRRLNVGLLAISRGPSTRNEPAHFTSVRAQAAAVSLDDERPELQPRRAALFRNVFEPALDVFVPILNLRTVCDDGCDGVGPQAGRRNDIHRAWFSCRPARKPDIRWATPARGCPPSCSGLANRRFGFSFSACHPPPEEGSPDNVVPYNAVAPATALVCSFLLTRPARTADARLSRTPMWGRRKRKNPPFSSSPFSSFSSFASSSFASPLRQHAEGAERPFRTETPRLDDAIRATPVPLAVCLACAQESRGIRLASRAHAVREASSIVGP